MTSFVSGPALQRKLTMSALAWIVYVWLPRLYGGFNKSGP